MRLQKWCACGAVLDTHVDRRKRPVALAVWYERHSGQGHGDVTTVEAERVRMGAGVAYGRIAESEKK